MFSSLQSRVRESNDPFYKFRCFFFIEKAHPQKFTQSLTLQKFSTFTLPQRTTNFNVTNKIDTEKVELQKQSTKTRHNFASPELLTTFRSLPNDCLVFGKRFLVNSVKKVKL